MATAVKVLIGLVLLLPMTAYVTWSLVAAAEAPQPHQPIIVEQPTKTPANPGQSPSQKHTHKHSHKPSDEKTHRGDDHGGRSDDHQTEPPIISPSPELFDDHGGGDSSGKGSGDDSSGKGSGHG